MPVSADSLQLAHVKETAPGVTPANPQFHVWRTTGESLSFAPQTSESGELGGAGRFAKPANVTGLSISGDINFELSKFPALEEAIASTFAAEWGICPATGAAAGGIDGPDRITVGKTPQTYTLEKRFPNGAYVAGGTVTLATSGVPGATPDITVGGGPSVGTGIAVVEISVDNGPMQHFALPVAVGMTAGQVATALAAEINGSPDLSATATGSTVDITTTGTSVTAMTARAGGDEFFYQRYRGVMYNSFSIAVAPNAPVTGSCNTVGGVPELDYLPLPGATYQSAGTSAVFTAPEVLDLTIGSILGIGTHCWTSLNIDLGSNNRGIACIGTKGDKEVVLGTFSCQISGDVYFSDQAILEALLNNETVGDSVVSLSNADGDVYRFDLLGLKPISGSLAAGGAGQDLTIPLTLQPTPRDVCGGWESGLVLSKVNTAPALP